MARSENRQLSITAKLIASDADGTTISTRQVVEVLKGGEGDDRAYGGAGSDLIRGGGGDDFLFGDQIFDVEFAGKGHDFGAAVVAVLGEQLGELLADDGALALRIGEDRVVVRDLDLDLGQLVHDLLPLERSETAQLQVEELVRLAPGDPVGGEPRDDTDDGKQRGERQDSGAAQRHQGRGGTSQPTPRTLRITSAPNLRRT